MKLTLLEHALAGLGLFIFFISIDNNKKINKQINENDKLYTDLTDYFFFFLKAAGWTVSFIASPIEHIKVCH